MICKRCKKEQGDNFWKDKSRPSGFHPYCIDCGKKIKYTYYNNNKEDILSKTKEWAQNNPEKRAIIKKRWYSNNPELVRMYRMERRMREDTLSDNTITKETLEQLPKEVCGICGGILDMNAKDEKGYSQVHLDHIIPLIQGGSHSIHNLQWTHATCNLKKGGRLK